MQILLKKEFTQESQRTCKLVIINKLTREFDNRGQIHSFTPLNESENNNKTTKI